MVISVSKLFFFLSEFTWIVDLIILISLDYQLNCNHLKNFFFKQNFSHFPFVWTELQMNKTCWRALFTQHDLIWLSREYLNTHFKKGFKPIKIYLFFTKVLKGGDKLLVIHLLSFEKYDIRSNFISFRV